MVPIHVGSQKGDSEVAMETRAMVEKTDEMWDVGNDFRGFHIRFCDVARGGIRIVMSRNKECM